MSKFQIILLSVFGLFILIAVATFAFYRGSSSGMINVTIWGSLPYEDFNSLLASGVLAQDKNFQVSYVEVPESSLEKEFTEALAEGSGPDLIVLRQDQLWKNKSKLLAIPYASVGEREFTDTFAESGEIYLMSDGIYALPLVSDPLVLYYNRDLLSAGGIAKPLAYWDEIFKETGNLTKRDAAGNIVRSSIALGEFKNIANAKDIISLLLLQAGTPITAFSGGDLQSVLRANFGLSVAPAEAALEFYTQFSNPTKSFYSWNRTLPEAQTRFTSGDVAYYLGFASELRTLRSKNPTLNFSVVSAPQSRVSGKSLTVGRLYGISVTRGARDPQAALTAAWRLTSAPSAAALSKLMLLPPARRDLLSEKPTDTVLPIFYNSALQMKGWVDPSPKDTAKIFSDMIESVTSGRARISESVSKAHDELNKLIKN